MDYYDGNTVTALWNYAQHYAMSDNMYATNYGPSTPGALNVIAGQNYGATCGPTFATINDSPCPAPPGYNGANVVASISPPAANRRRSRHHLQRRRPDLRHLLVPAVHRRRRRQRAATTSAWAATTSARN